MRPTLLRCSLFVLLAAPAALLAQFGVDFVEPRAATSANHRLQFSPIDSQAHRPFALAVAGTRNNPQRKAVQVRRSGPAFVGVHGVDAAGYHSSRTTEESFGLPSRPARLLERRPQDVHSGEGSADDELPRLRPDHAAPGSSTCASFGLRHGLSRQPSPSPGIGELGIGANFPQPWTFPATIAFDPLTSSVRWSEPDLGDLRLHCNGVAVDPRSIIPFPLPTTDARSARGS